MIFYCFKTFSLFYSFIFLFIGLLCCLCSVPIGADNSKIVNVCELSNYASVASLQKCSNNSNTIDIKNSTIRGIPNEIFQRFPLLTNLNLKQVGIASIDNVQFSQEQKLIKLDLSNNVITAIPANKFINLTNLQVLLLKNNTIKEIYEDSFKHLISLETLDLTDNQISKLPEGVLNPLVRLKQLDLARNKLQIIDPDVFSKTTSLQILDLMNNSISTIQEGAFKSLGQLDRLHVSLNPFYEIDLTQLNNIHTIEIEKTNLKSITVPSSLKKLFANGNQITHIFVPDSTSLEILELDDNDLRNDFYNITRLSNVRQVNLAYNNITKIEWSKLTNMNNLDRLDLYGNEIKEFNWKFVRTNLPKLSYIKLTISHWTSNFIIQFRNNLTANGVTVDTDIGCWKAGENFTELAPTSEDVKKHNDSVNQLIIRLDKLEFIRQKSDKETQEQMRSVERTNNLIFTIFCLYIVIQCAMFVKRKYYPNGFQILLHNRSRRANDDTEPIFQEPLHTL